MPADDSTWLTHAFSALGSKNRLQIMELLRERARQCRAPEGECTFTDHCCHVSELAEELGISQATASHHLKELSRAGLVETVRRGRFVYCAVSEPGLRRLEGFLQGVRAAC